MDHSEYPCCELSDADGMPAGLTPGPWRLARGRDGGRDRPARLKERPATASSASMRPQHTLKLLSPPPGLVLPASRRHPTQQMSVPAPVLGAPRKDAIRPLRLAPSAAALTRLQASSCHYRQSCPTRSHRVGRCCVPASGPLACDSKQDSSHLQAARRGSSSG